MGRRKKKQTDEMPACGRAGISSVLEEGIYPDSADWESDIPIKEEDTYAVVLHRGRKERISKKRE